MSTKTKKPAKGDKARTVKVTLIRSVAKKLSMHVDNVHGLGLRRIRQSVVVAATPQNMGMVNNSAHMFLVEETTEAVTGGAGRSWRKERAAK